MPRYHPDGTFIQSTFDGAVYEVRDNAHTLILRGHGNASFRNWEPGFLTTPLGREYVDTNGWYLAEIRSANTRPVTPCNCPRHQGVPTFHGVG